MPLRCAEIEYQGCVNSDCFFIEESSLQSDSCSKWVSPTFFSSLFSSCSISLQSLGKLEHVVEFKELSENAVELDSTHFRLFSNPIVAFLKSFDAAYGIRRLLGQGISLLYPDVEPNNEIHFSLFIEPTGAYHYESVLKIWAATYDQDTTGDGWRGFLGSDGERISLPECNILASSVWETSAAQTSTTSLVYSGALPLYSVDDQYIVVDVGGRIVATGSVHRGDAPRTIPLPAGVYLIVTSSARHRVLILP